MMNPILKSGKDKMLKDSYDVIENRITSDQTTGSFLDLPIQNS